MLAIYCPRQSLPMKSKNRHPCAYNIIRWAELSTMLSAWGWGLGMRQNNRSVLCWLLHSVDIKTKALCIENRECEVSAQNGILYTCKP